MPARVLVVDDDRISNEIISKALAANGFTVDTAKSGIEAVGLIKNNNYDLALVDYLTPELDGLTSARIFRSVGDAKNLPKLVAITSDVASLKARKEAQHLFHSILPKPLKPDDIVQYVDATFRETERGHQFAAVENILAAARLCQASARHRYT
jgi:CheY-like chemotaxis protein